MHVITKTKDLAAACQRLAAHDYVTVDTEFLRETTFWPKLCVIQMAGPDMAFIVDALSEGLDLEPFFELMRDGNVTKFFTLPARTSKSSIIWENLSRPRCSTLKSRPWFAALVIPFPTTSLSTR